jgi:hypothetical protein
MRTGYASTLLNRTRGQAPLLLPPSPSRFEPDTGSADLHDDITAPGPAAAGAELSDTSPPLLGYRQPAPTPAAPDELSGLPTQPEAGSPTRPRREPPRRAVTEPLDPTSQPPPRPVSAPDSAREPPGQAAAESAEAPWSITTARATPLARPEHVTATVSNGPPARSAAAHEDEHVEAEPPVVVHIGRLDVRAVHSPTPAPQPDPWPRRAAGPTLEERLAARDRR